MNFDNLPSFVFADEFKTKDALKIYAGNSWASRLQCEEPCVRFTKEQEKDIFLRFNFARFKATQQNKNRYLWRRKAIKYRNKIVFHNQPLVMKLLGKYNEPPEDLFSDCMLSLMKTVEKFNPFKGFKFSSYAYSSIVNKILEYKKIAARKNNFKTVDLSNISIPYDEKGFDICQNKQDVLTLLSRTELSKQEKDIIFRIYGLYGFAPHTQKQAGAIWGISNERARQICNRAIGKIKEAVLNPSN